MAQQFDQELIQRAAQRAGGNPFFLAWSFGKYPGTDGTGRYRRLDGDRQMLAFLSDREPISEQESRQRLAEIGLARRPTTRSDAELIASRFGLDTERLIYVVRIADEVGGYWLQATGHEAGFSVTES